MPKTIHILFSSTKNKTRLNYLNRLSHGKIDRLPNPASTEMIQTYGSNVVIPNVTLQYGKTTEGAIHYVKF